MVKRKKFTLSGSRHKPRVCSEDYKLDQKCILLKGYLIKSPPLTKHLIKKSWHKRYFVLYDRENGYERRSEGSAQHGETCLIYYKRKGDEEWINKIPLVGATVCENPAQQNGHQYVITLQTAERKFFLCADTQKDHDSWLTKLKETITFTQGNRRDSVELLLENNPNPVDHTLFGDGLLQAKLNTLKVARQASTPYDVSQKLPLNFQTNFNDDSRTDSGISADHDEENTQSNTNLTDSVFIRHSDTRTSSQNSDEVDNEYVNFTKIENTGYINVDSVCEPNYHNPRVSTQPGPEDDSCGEYYNINTYYPQHDRTSQGPSERKSASEYNDYQHPPYPRNISQEIYDVPPPNDGEIYDIPPTSDNQEGALYTNVTEDDVYDVPPTTTNVSEDDVYDVPPPKRNDIPIAVTVSEDDVYDVPPSKRNDIPITATVSEDDVYDVPSKTVNQENEIYDIPPVANVRVDDTYDVPPPSHGVNEPPNIVTREFDPSSADYVNVPKAYPIPLTNISAPPGRPPKPVQLRSAPKDSPEHSHKQFMVQVSHDDGELYNVPSPYGINNETYDTPSIRESRSLPPSLRNSFKSDNNNNNFQTTHENVEEDIYNVPPVRPNNFTQQLHEEEDDAEYSLIAPSFNKPLPSEPMSVEDVVALQLQRNAGYSYLPPKPANRSPRTSYSDAPLPSAPSEATHAPRPNGVTHTPRTLKPPIPERVGSFPRETSPRRLFKGNSLPTYYDTSFDTMTTDADGYLTQRGEDDDLTDYEKMLPAEDACTSNTSPQHSAKPTEAPIPRQRPLKLPTPEKERQPITQAPSTGFNERKNRFVRSAPSGY